MSKAEYKISVIVPVYNKADYLEQCIDSILAQTYGSFELLLIDDGSTDASGAICERYADMDERVRTIRQQNQGPTAAVANGMNQASGDYYTFVDSDDYISADMLEEMAACLVGQPGEIVCCNHVLEKRKETIPVIQPLPAGIYEGSRLDSEVKAKLLGLENRIIPMSRCMKLCEKSVFQGNEKYYDTTLRMGDDFNLIYPALLAASRIVIMKEALFYHYRYVDDSIVHAYDPDNARSVAAWFRAVHRIVSDKKVPDGEAGLDREYCYMLIYVMKNELRNPGHDYMSRIREIFMRKEVRDKILNTPLTVRNRTNALMYAGMRHPDRALIWILRMIVRSYDRSGRKGNGN